MQQSVYSIGIISDLLIYRDISPTPLAPSGRRTSISSSSYRPICRRVGAVYTYMEHLSLLQLAKLYVSTSISVTDIRVPGHKNLERC